MFNFKKNSRIIMIFLFILNFIIVCNFFLESQISFSQDIIKQENFKPGNSIDKQGKFAGGIGTKENPYWIATAEQLNNVRNHLNEHFIQVADIDLNIFSKEKEWVPIGIDDKSGINKFTGTYNGNGYVISNLTIKSPEGEDIGLFGLTGPNAIIYNVSLEKIDIIGNIFVGGLVGKNIGGNMINNSVTGKIRGNSNNIGGLVGNNIIGNIRKCFTLVKVIGKNYVGGLVGRNILADINESYAKGNVKGDRYIGGLVGRNVMGNIIKCYAWGDVIGKRRDIGGLIGRSALNIGEIQESYAIGKIISEKEKFIGGIVGSVNSDVIEDCYYDKNTSGHDNSKYGIVKTTEEMKQEETYDNWDFTNTWEIISDETYPYFKWQEENEFIAD